ncbi:MAG: oligosaccharide repeat unit polymerase [Alcaligenaceae bacterium]|nr:oligosaccharide repeat unit polymerase [Alcaligenaceae bacterium]
MISQKHLIYIFLNSCFATLSGTLSWFGEGYTFFIYCFSFVLLLTQAIHQLNLRSIFFWFVLCYLTLFYLSPISEFLFPGEVLSGTPRSIEIYHILNIASIHIFCAVYFLFYRKKDESVLILVNSSRFDLALYIMGALTILSALWMLKSVGGFSAINMTRVELKYVQGGKGLALLLSYFSSVFYVLLGVFLARKKFNPIYVLMVLVLFLLLEYIYFISLRNRTMIMTHLLAIPVGFYIFKRMQFTRGAIEYRNKTPSKVKVTPLLLALGLLSILGVFVRFARGVYVEGSGALGMSLKDMLIVSVKSGDMGYANMVIRIFDYAYIHDFFLNGQSYYRLLMAFVPSFIYDKKIPTTDSLIGQMLTGLDVMTIPPGVFGDAYLNYGFLGLIVFICYGVIFSLFDRSKKVLSSYLFFAISFTFIYHFVRGSFVNVIISLTIVYLGVYVATKIIKPRYLYTNR